MEIKQVPSIPFLGVTPDGRVMNLISHKWLAVCDNGYGYKQVFVSVRNKRYVRYVHRLVAECYVPNPANAPEINHKNGDKSNNHKENLEWCTRGENVHHAYSTGLRATTEKQRQVARENGKRSIPYLRAGWQKWSQTEIAREHWKRNISKADRWHKKNTQIEGDIA